MTTTLAANASIAPPTARARWTARIVTALPVLFLAFDVALKIVNPPVVVETSATLGLPTSLTPVCAALLAVCLALYLVPRTAALGAVLLTGYLGGAVLVHARVGDPLLSHTLFPVYVGALLWLGLYLRDERVRRLLAPR
jgi:hypothetical protein